LLLSYWTSFYWNYKRENKQEMSQEESGKEEKTLFPLMTREPQVKNTQRSAEVWAVSSFWRLKAESMLFFQWS